MGHFHAVFKFRREAPSSAANGDVSPLIRRLREQWERAAPWISSWLFAIMAVIFYKPQFCLTLFSIQTDGLTCGRCCRHKQADEEKLEEWKLLQPAVTLCEDCPLNPLPLMHVRCSIWGLSARSSLRLSGWGGQVRWARFSGDPGVPWRVWGPWDHRCAWRPAARTACPMQFHQPVHPGKEPRPSPLLPSWPHISTVWWLHSGNLGGIN